MNVVLWSLQLLLALHTLVGAAWKLSNPAQAVPSLQAIPHGVWVGMSVLELGLAVALVLPAWKKAPPLLAPLAAATVAAEMLFFCVVHLASGATEHGQLVYWLVVAAVCAFVALGRRSPRAATGQPSLG